MSHVGLCIEILKERLIWEIARYPESGTVILTLVFFSGASPIFILQVDGTRNFNIVLHIHHYVWKNQSTESIKLMPRFAGYILNITVYIWLLISRHLILCYIIIVFSKIYDPFLIYYSFWWDRHIMCYQIKLW